ncbi:MAG TPA: DUF1844 domain-containing protein [Desulfobulbaceae bacterium]|nr:DUF1844 domain-containing protein [Desulfobulbaceae bacterium]
MSEMQNCKPCPDGRVRNEAGKCVMPEVTFTSFVLSLNTTALFHLGELPHPETGERKVDLELVKHSIDTLIMLQGKTSGNLDTSENELLSHILYDLKMRFIKAKDQSR